MSYNTIPPSIDKKMGDTAIPIGTSNNFSVTIKLKSLVFWLGGFFLLAYIVLQGPYADFVPVGMKILWVIFGAIAIFYFGRTTKTGELVISQIETAVDYTFSSRRIDTKSFASSKDFEGLVGILSIEPRNSTDPGLIEYLSGELGYAYSISGSASRLLFDGDAEAVKGRTRGFLDRLDPSWEMTKLTYRGPQSVHHQIAANELRYQKLKNRDPDLLAVLNARQKFLMEEVQVRYYSLQQVLFISAPSIDELRKFHEMIHREVSASSYYFATVDKLAKEDIEDTLGRIYRVPVKV